MNVLLPVAIVKHIKVCHDVTEEVKHINKHYDNCEKHI